MITRQDYIKDGSNLHRAYYGQFVNEEVKQRVLRYFPIDILKESFTKDGHFNNKLTPMKKWDLMGGFLWNRTPNREVLIMKPETSEDIEPVDYKLLKETGEGLSCAGMVCIYKEAAKQILEEIKK